MKRFRTILLASWVLALVVGVLSGMATTEAVGDEPPISVKVQKKVIHGGGGDDIDLPVLPCDGCASNIIHQPPGGETQTCYLSDCTYDSCIYTCY